MSRSSPSPTDPCSTLPRVPWRYHCRGHRNCRCLRHAAPTLTLNKMPQCPPELAGKNPRKARFDPMPSYPRVPVKGTLSGWMGKGLNIRLTSWLTVGFPVFWPLWRLTDIAVFGPRSEGQRPFQSLQNYVAKKTHDAVLQAGRRGLSEAHGRRSKWLILPGRPWGIGPLSRR